MDKRLIYTNPKHFNNSFKKEEYKKTPCAEGEANLNESGEKTFNVKISQMMAYYHESMIMEQLEIKDTINEITLENDYFPAKYSSIKLLFGTTDIENITTSPGEASTIMQLVNTTETYRKTYGALSGWFPDTNDKADDKNKGFVARKEYYNGKTLVTIFYPLRNLFGIFADYPKMFYGIENITLILNRNTDDAISKRIFFGSKLKDEATAAKLPKFVTKKLEWWIPIYTPNLTAETFFHNQLNKDKNVGIGFMKRRMAKTTFMVSDFAWTITEVNKHVRMVAVGFKTEKDDAKKNNNLFTLKNIRKVRISVNSEDYPEVNMNTDTGNVGEPYLSYVRACEFFGVEPQLNIKEYTDLYPIIWFNTTSQNETIKGNSIVVTIEKEGTDQVTAYALALEEEHLIIDLTSNSIRKVSGEKKD